MNSLRISFFVCLSSLFSFSSLAQSDTITLVDTLKLAPVKYDKYFNLHYNQALWKVRRTYPLAVKAKEIIDELEADLAATDGKRKKKKLTKERKDALKDDFTYLLKDLYIGEGAMLFQLIYRETGMTAKEILKKYNGTVKANATAAVFKMYGQNAESTYDAEGADWITELVIQDIISGRISIDMTVKSLSKDTYKSNMKEYREDVREYRKAKRKE